MAIDPHNGETGVYSALDMVPQAANPDAGATSGNGTLWVDLAGKLNYKNPAGTPAAISSAADLASGVTFVQTYSTASATVPAATSHAITDNSGGAASASALAAQNQGTLTGVDGTANNAAPLAGVNTALGVIGNNIATQAAEIALVKADLLAAKQVINKLIDVLQLVAIAG